MIRNLALIFITTFILTSARAQLMPNDTIDINRQIVAFTTNTQKHFFIADPKGNIFEYDLSGNLINQHSSEQQRTINHLRAQTSLSLFAYSSVAQTGLIFSNKLTLTSEISLDQYKQEYIDCATLSADQNIWCYEGQSRELYKLILASGSIFQKNNLAELMADKGDMLQLIEYQGKLYSFTSKGYMLVFDRFGSFQAFMQVNDANLVAFEKDSLYYLTSSNNLIKLSLYTGVEENKGQLPDCGQVMGMGFCQNQLLLASAKKVFVFDIK